MNLLSVEKITKTYGVKSLFSELSFGIGEGEKIGLIGVNGSGKSTLIKILAGVEHADSGQVTWANNVRFGYLSQNPSFNRESTVLESAIEGNSPLMKLVREYETVLIQAEIEAANTEIQQKLLRLGEQMDQSDAWRLESEAKTILTKLGITDFAVKMGLLSGGQRKRVVNAVYWGVSFITGNLPMNNFFTNFFFYASEFTAAAAGMNLFFASLNNKVLYDNEQKRKFVKAKKKEIRLTIKEYKARLKQNKIAFAELENGKKINKLINGLASDYSVQLQDTELNEQKQKIAINSDDILKEIAKLKTDLKNIDASTQLETDIKIVKEESTQPTEPQPKKQLSDKELETSLKETITDETDKLGKRLHKKIMPVLNATLLEKVKGSSTSTEQPASAEQTSIPATVEKPAITERPKNTPATVEQPTTISKPTAAEQPTVQPKDKKPGSSNPTSDDLMGD